MKDWLMEHKLYAVAALLIVAVGIYYLGNDYREPAGNQEISLDNNAQADQTDAEMPKSEMQEAVEPEMIIVDVKGQVNQPGVYKANSGERVIDVIGRAGGLTEQADQTKVNLAEHVQDAMVIYIPAKGEEVAAAGVTSGGSSASVSGISHVQGKININTADETQLQNLPGIGPSKAAAIIEYRTTSGPFKTVDDLKNVSGIGDKTFEKLEAMASVK